MTRQNLAQRVADLWRCDSVAGRVRIHEEYCRSSRPAAATNLQRRTPSLFMRWVLAPLPVSRSDLPQKFEFIETLACSFGYGAERIFRNMDR